MEPAFTAADVADAVSAWMTDSPVRDWTVAQVTAEVMRDENTYDGLPCDAEWRAAVLAEVLRLRAVPLVDEQAEEDERAYQRLVVFQAFGF